MKAKRVSSESFGDDSTGIVIDGSVVVMICKLSRNRCAVCTRQEKDLQFVHVKKKICSLHILAFLFSHGPEQNQKMDETIWLRQGMAGASMRCIKTNCERLVVG